MAIFKKNCLFHNKIEINIEYGLQTKVKKLYTYFKIINYSANLSYFFIIFTSCSRFILSCYIKFFYSFNFVYVNSKFFFYISYILFPFRGNFMFTTFMVPLFIFTTTKRTFSKIHSSLSGKRLLYTCSLYI